MKKRKFSTGGKFELDADALASGLRMGSNERISDADREAAIEATTGPGSKGFKRLTDKEAADLMGREVNMPEAVAIPVAAPRRLVGRELPERDMESDQLSRNVPAPRTATPTAAPSRGDYSRNGPIGDLVERAMEPKGKVTPRPRMVPSDTTDGMTSNKPKPKPKPKGMSDSPYKKGGAVKASKRADGIAQRGKTKGRFV
jgi:hypothetical protein